MINWNRLIRKTSHPRSLLAKIAAGYITVLLTVGCIIYIGIHEWREIRSIETNVRQINRQKRTIRNVYMKMLELSLFCDIFTEWDEKDFNTYLKQKSAVDSLLYGLQELHPNARIDSIRILWKDKEQSMLQIKEIMRKQQQAGREIAGQLPQTAGQSPPKKTGRKGGFLKRLFGKKEKTETSPNASALHALNRTIADRQRQYARQLGIDFAQGEYTIHIDPDDWVEPKMLEELYKKAKSEHADMVICDYYVNRHDNQYHEVQKPTALDAETVLHDIFRGLHANCWNKLIRRSCYTEYDIRFPENLSYREDFCVITQLLLHPIKISYINQALYHYAQNPNQTSISFAKNEKTLHDQLTVVENVRSYLNGKYPECLNTLRADVACWLIESGFKDANEIRAEYSDLLNAGVIMSLPKNRRIKIFISFFLGKSVFHHIHHYISVIKHKWKNH